MPMLAETLDGVIGVDTHRDTLTAAAVTAIGGLLAHATAPTDAAGYRELRGSRPASCRVSAAGRSRVPAASAPAWRPFCLTMVSRSSRFHADADRPRRTAAKSDALDAVHIARDALITQHPAIVPRRGDREALRVLLTTRRNAVTAWTQTVSQLKALIVSAPEELRAELRGRGTKAQITYCAASASGQPDPWSIR